MSAGTAGNGIGKTGGTIRSADTNEEIQFSYRRVSLRKFEKALELLEGTTAEGLTRQQKIANRDEAFGILVDGPKVLDEATFPDVQAILQAAITFNQIGPDDEKKSE